MEDGGSEEERIPEVPVAGLYVWVVSCFGHGCFGVS